MMIVQVADADDEDDVIVVDEPGLVVDGTTVPEPDRELLLDVDPICDDEKEVDEDVAELEEELLLISRLLAELDDEDKGIDVLVVALFVDVEEGLLMIELEVTMILVEERALLVDVALLGVLIGLEVIVVAVKGIPLLIETGIGVLVFVTVAL